VSASHSVLLCYPVDFQPFKERAKAIRECYNLISKRSTLVCNFLEGTVEYIYMCVCMYVYVCAYVCIMLCMYESCYACMNSLSEYRSESSTLCFTLHIYNTYIHTYIHTYTHIYIRTYRYQNMGKESEVNISSLCNFVLHLRC